MSLARNHRERCAAAALAAAAGPSTEGGRTPELGSLIELRSDAADQAASETHLRLLHDLRRLKEIKSITRKIEAKREMLPAYDAWIDGMLQAAAESGRGVQDEVLPTVMIWRIDTGDFIGAMKLVRYVLDHDIALPTRYARDSATLIVEEIADAALKLQQAGDPFDLAILLEVEELTRDLDMHDEVRAKLVKAIGVELMGAAEALAPEADDFLPACERALAALQRAHGLHDRVGVKDRVKRLEKAIAAVAAANGQVAGDGD